MIKAIEFFSGIGGMHFGLKSCLIDAQVIKAFEISPVANECYAHNFKMTPCQTSIESVSVDQLDKLEANCWLLSPPCQPYTRTGKMMDTHDPRAKALTYLISILPLLSKPLKYIFLENVIGFEHSQSRNQLVRALLNLGYDFTEWHLSPVQFGIPNERPRYYMTAALSDKKTELRCDDEIPSPVIVAEFPQFFESKSLKDFLDLGNEMVNSLPSCILKNRRYISKSEISRASDTRSKCFTKAYGHHGLHSGCFLMTREVPLDLLDGCLEDPLKASQTLGLRMFSPAEISRLHFFPETFQFPPKLSIQQQWKLLGNSMNIFVVSQLLAKLFGCDLRSCNS